MDPKNYSVTSQRHPHVADDDSVDSSPVRFCHEHQVLFRRNVTGSDYHVIGFRDV